MLGTLFQWLGLPGGWMPSLLVVPCLAGSVQAIRHEPMTVYGDGKQTRSFQFVSDLVSGSCKVPACHDH